MSNCLRYFNKHTKKRHQNKYCGHHFNHAGKRLLHEKMITIEFIMMVEYRNCKSFVLKLQFNYLIDFMLDYFIEFNNNFLLY